MTTQAEIKEIIQDYVLICYDIPATAKKQRHDFLKGAHAIGAIGYTESVYLLPDSEKSFELANELATIGNAVVWRATQENLKVAIEITTNYEQHIHARCQHIEMRILWAQEHMAAGRLKMANRMGIKTVRLLRELAEINETFNPDWLKPRLDELVEKWKAVHSKKEV